MYAYVRALYAWRATHVQPFSVVDEAEAHRYYLIHAATHGTATEKFKDAIREAMNRRATGASAQTSLIYSSDLNVEAIVEDLATHFAGQTVRWSDGHAPGTVKKYLLQETNALHSDLVHVRKSLDRRGWAAPGRTKIYAFPAT
jgi:hypothetical protein